MRENIIEAFELLDDEIEEFEIFNNRKVAELLSHQDYDAVAVQVDKSKQLKQIREEILEIKSNFIALDLKKETEPREQNLQNEKSLKEAYSRSKFHSDCVNLVGDVLENNFEKSTKTSYKSSDKKIHLICLASREYEEQDLDEGVMFWFTLRPSQLDFLNEVGRTGYLALGCGSADSFLLIPAEELKPYLNLLNQNEKNGDQYYHLKLIMADDEVWLIPKRGIQRVNWSDFWYTSNTAEERWDSVDEGDENIPILNREEIPVFMIKRGEKIAKGIFNGSGLIVLKGSLMRKETAPSIPSQVKSLRKALIEGGYVTEQPEGFRFVKSYEFSSPSSAAGALLGRSSNGQAEWKDERGRAIGRG